MTKAYILLNLGAPADASAGAAEAFLRNFLSDPYVIGAPFFIRKIIARLIARKSSLGYSVRVGEISEGGKHPLIRHTEILADEIRALTGVSTIPAFRYGGSLPAAIERARDFGAERFVFLPMYPQRAFSTTVSAVQEILRLKRRGDEFYCVPSYYDEPLYISALSEGISKALSEGASAVLASFHSLPLSAVKRSPYVRDCAHTVGLLKRELNFEKIDIAWQSKMGRGKWLEPSAESMVDSIISRGDLDLAVLCPGFACDCTETLIEVDRDLRSRFLSRGGRSFRFINALNSSSQHAKLLAELFERHSDIEKSKL